MIKHICMVATLLGAVSVNGEAHAKKFIVEQSMSPYVACYDKEYVPAEVEVNTRGKLVRGQSQYWATSDTRWDLVNSPSVYIQTRRVVSPEHYALVKRDC